MSHIRDAVTIDTCDREPIHIPGSIQPHGCMLVSDDALFAIKRASENAGPYLRLTGDALKELPIASILGESLTHDLRNIVLVSSPNQASAVLMDRRLGHGDQTYNLSVHRSGDEVILEFEAANAAPHHGPLELSRQLINRLTTIVDSDHLLQETPRLLAATIPYDRIMIYRFGPDGAGQVISETRRPPLESFLGQYFPASDIPQQARVLYLKSLIRMVANVNAGQLPIMPVLNERGLPLDMSYAHLRSVSPIHLEYLRNMGVGASMSISIIIDGQLWGLIACHHYEPRILTMSERAAAEIFGQFFSLHLQMTLARERLEAAGRSRRFLEQMLIGSMNYATTADLLSQNLTEIRQLIASDGAGLLIDGQFSGNGILPPQAAFPAIQDLLSRAKPKQIFATDSLGDHIPLAADYANDAAGMLAVPLSQAPRDYLLFFRRAQEQTLNWAGDPNKTYETGPYGDRLTPRKSFAIWKETVKGRAHPWNDTELEIAESTRIGLVEILLRHNEALANERADAELRRQRLNDELNHRVKNILSLIKSLVAQPARDGQTIEDYVKSLVGRIHALSNAHDQIIKQSGSGNFEDLIRVELTPYQQPENTITMAGPPVELSERAFAVMALVMHELATNAAKYGGLSRAGGRLDISWQRQADDSCSILWQEMRPGHDLAAPIRQGFGSSLIRRSVPFDLNGTCEIAYNPDGLLARFMIPAAHLHWRMGASPAPARQTTTAGQGVAGLTILVVEDQLLIAMDVENSLRLAGAADVVLCSTSDDAIKALQNVTPHIAVLDFNLGRGQTAQPVAQHLADHKIPFVFTTGYNDIDQLPATLRDRPMLQKPYDPAMLIAMINQCLAGANQHAD